MFIAKTLLIQRLYHIPANYRVNFLLFRYNDFIIHSVSYLSIAFILRVTIDFGNSYIRSAKTN